MNFDPSILVKIAAILTSIGALIGSVALYAAHRQRKAERAGLHSAAALRLTEVIADMSKTKTRADSTIQISEINAMQRN